MLDNEQAVSIIILKGVITGLKNRTTACFHCRIGSTTYAVKFRLAK